MDPKQVLAKKMLELAAKRFVLFRFLRLRALGKRLDAVKRALAYL